MTHHEYELIFEIEPISEEAEMKLLGEVDAFLGGHSGVCLLTVTWDGADALDAAQAAVEGLASYGITVIRAVEDLVSRGEIAQRTGVTRQAVSNWTRGDRGSDFPVPHVLAGGGLWHWTEVNLWLREHGLQADSLTLPTISEITHINYELGRRCRSTRRSAALKQGFLEVPAAPMVAEETSRFIKSLWVHLGEGSRSSFDRNITVHYPSAASLDFFWSRHHEDVVIVPADTNIEERA